MRMYSKLIQMVAALGILLCMDYNSPMQESIIYEDVSSPPEVCEYDLVYYESHSPLLNSLPPDPEPAELYFIEEENGALTEDSVRSICEYVGNIYDIDPWLIQSIMWHESRYYYNVTSSGNAKGLCQIIEGYHKDRIAKLKINDIYDPVGNVLICGDILNEIRNYPYGDDINYILMVYSQGKHSADTIYESGNISNYAKCVMDTALMMEEQYD